MTAVHWYLLRSLKKGNVNTNNKKRIKPFSKANTIDRS